MASGPCQPSSPFLRRLPRIRTALTTHAVRCALAGIALGATAAAAPLTANAQSAVQGRIVDFSIPAGTLDEVLGRFGRAAVVTVATDPQLTRGVSSQGLAGRYSVTEGLSRLLSGTGLEAIPNANGEGYRLQRSPQAANPTSPVTLPTVLVSGRQLDATSEGTGSYAARAVTMFGKTAVAPKDIPSSVSVLTRQQMDDQNIRSIQDAMQRATGITSVDYGDGTGYFNARGFPVNVQFDGISIASGIQYQPQFDMAMYDRIEIFRGPSGLMDGQGSLGGSVNLVRKAPSDQFHVISETSMGSWADYRQMIDVTGPLNKEGTLRGRVVGVGAKSNSFTDGENSKEGMAYGIIEYDPNPNTTVSLSVGYQSFPLDKFDYGIGLDEGDNLVQGPRGRSQNYGPDWNHSYMSLQEANGSIKHRMDNGWKTEGTVFYRRYYSSGKYGYANPPPAGSNIADYSGQSQQITDHWFGIDANISGPITLFGRQHDILLGANYSSFKQESLSGFQDLGEFDIFKPAIPDPSIPYDFGTDQRTEQYGVYGQARLRLADPLSVVLGGRELYFRQQTRGTLPTEEDWTTASRENGKFVPYAGVIYDLTKQVSAYTSYTKIFSAQSATTFNGGALPPLSGEQYEVGLKGSFFDNRLNASVAAFRINGDDLAVQDADHPTGSVASGAVRSQGWEAEVSGTPLPNWNVTAGYTLLNTSYLSSPTQEGQAFDTEEPRHLFKLWTNYRFTQGTLQGASLGGGMLLQSSTSRSAVPQAGYAVFGLKAGYQFNSHLEATVAVNNLFDRRYYDRAPGFYYSQYGTPRSVMLTVRATY